jgi:hypothetical protein
MPPPPHQRSVFILRIWRESGGALRGSLQTAPAGDLRYFATLNDLLTLLQTTLGEAAAPELDDPPAPPQHC